MSESEKQGVMLFGKTYVILLCFFRDRPYDIFYDICVYGYLIYTARYLCRIFCDTIGMAGVVYRQLSALDGGKMSINIVIMIGTDCKKIQ